MNIEGVPSAFWAEVALEIKHKIVGRCLQVALKCFYTNIFLEYEMRAADCKYSELRTSRNPGVRGTHPCITITGRTRIRRRWRPSGSREQVWPRCSQGVAPAAKTPQTSQDRNVLAMFWARPRWTMWRSQRGARPSSVTAVYYVTMLWPGGDGVMCHD